LSANRSAVHALVTKLPLVTLYLTDRCNSRCVTCDYWRHGRDDMNLDAVARLLPSFARLNTRLVLLSGGEPLLNPDWMEIAQLLRRNGLKVWLLTSGLSLAKHAGVAAEMFDSITVSLDGTNRGTYTAIRGLDAFDKVCAGIHAAAAAGTPPNLRVTLQRANYRELSGFVDLARQVGARQVSFLAVDVANPHAFARRDDFRADLALDCEDLPEFERRLHDLERDHAEDFHSAFIAESPPKMQRILQYFAAVCRLGPFPPVHCNAPEFSSVITAQGKVQPCFFISGPPHALVRRDFGQTLNDDAMVALRRDIREGRRAECSTCVCSMWRDPTSFGAGDFPGSSSGRFATELQ
jgi:Fe-coproporphyrin III synthase